MAPSAARVFLPLVLVFLTAVLVARFLLIGSWGWVVFALSTPVLLALLASRVGFLPALAILVLYAGTVLLVRALLLGSALAIAVLLLVPVLVLVARIAYKVLRTLKEGPGALGIRMEREEE